VKPLVLGAAFLVAGCGGAVPADDALPLPRPGPHAPQDDPIVAFFNDEPLLRSVVANKAIEIDLKGAVDHYVRWRIVEERKKDLGIAHTPEEIRRRAEAVVREARAERGEEAFRAQLAAEGLTEETYVAHLRGSRALEDALALEKIVRYQALLEGAIMIDRMLFADAREARGFEELCRAKGFDASAEEVLAARRAGAIRRLPREVFPRSRPPQEPPLGPETGELLWRMKPGEITGVVTVQPGLHAVIRLADRREARALPYDRASGEIFEGILRHPPAASELRRWIESEFARCRIRYADLRGPRRDGR
jgi:hypothetical protein